MEAPDECVAGGRQESSAQATKEERDTPDGRTCSSRARACGESKARLSGSSTSRSKSSTGTGRADSEEARRRAPPRRAPPPDRPLARGDRAAVLRHSCRTCRGAPELRAPAFEQALRVLLQQPRERRIGSWRLPRFVEVLREAVRLRRVEAGEVEVAKRGAVDHRPAVELAQLSLVEVPECDVERAVADDHVVEVHRRPVDPPFVHIHPGGRLRQAVTRESVSPPVEERLTTTPDGDEAEVEQATDEHAVLDVGERQITASRERGVSPCAE